MTLNIDIWSDIACPWCFIGKRRFEKALDGFGAKDQVSVTWHSYQLDPTLPERSELSEHEYLEQAKGMPANQVAAMLAHVTEVARGEGLSYDFDSLVPANSMKAHQLLHAVKQAGLDVDAVKEALLSAHFEKGEAISDEEVLVRIGTDNGLTEDAARAALVSDELNAAVRADIDQASAIGVSGVPFFVFEGKYGVSGAQDSSVFTQVLEQVWEEIKPATPSFITIPGTENAPACGPEGC
ncbi:DsbA family oxidoreductase [Tessaracoccus rhinocerotis]|uniref:DsbA family oxidoreductase n=1 Tax=Tessaracoccus rhinocerotis TaxID=1689449 RepID=A0A553K272_9ACTN|nr:DsbA family oxidoreductase [Tessaracoccus rhinocerotis]TRY18801.1 DsbA family oxidoreductase [Tessaracoccus rhinocerotis]